MKKVIAAIIVLILAVSMARTVGVSAKNATNVYAMEDFTIVGAADCHEQRIRISSMQPCVIRLLDYYGQLLWSSDWDNQNLKISFSLKKGLHFSRTYYCGSDVYWIQARAPWGGRSLVTIEYDL